MALHLSPESLLSMSVRWPESFRGGCSFGTDLISSPDVDDFPLEDKFSEIKSPIYQNW